MSWRHRYDGHVVLLFVVVALLSYLLKDAFDSEHSELVVWVLLGVVTDKVALSHTRDLRLEIALVFVDVFSHTSS